MGWLHHWMAQRTGPRGSSTPHVESDDIHDSSPALEPRDGRGDERGSNDDRNRHNGGRRGDSAEEQSGDKGKGNDGNGDKDNNKNNDNKDDGGKKKPPDSSKSSDPPSSFTTTVTSVEPPTTVVIPPGTLTSTLTTTTEISTTSTQTGGSATPTSFTVSITTSVPAPSLSTVTASSLSISVTPTTVLPTPPSASTSQASTGAISSSELSPGAKAGIAIAALSAFALVLGGLYVCWRRGSSRTKGPAVAGRRISGTQGPLAQGAADMAQAGGRSVHDNGGRGSGAVDTSSWRTWHPYRPTSTQSNPPAAAVDFLQPPAPAFSRSTQDARRTQATWDTSSEPDSSAADRFSATALATYLSPAPTRPRRLAGSTNI